MTNPGYPLVLDVAGRRVAVVGGGPVAARRAAGLADADALVVVIAPELCAELMDLVEVGRVVWTPRGYAPGDLDEAWLVHTAAGDPEVDAQVASDAEAARIWCVRADDAELSAAWTPAIARRSDVSVAVTGGADPGRAAAIRDAIATQLDTGDLPLRRHRRGGTKAGRVTLVGGGPGDAELITTRGRRLLADADVVVVDRLAPRDLLDTLGSDVEVVEAGKGPKAERMTQARINELLVERARAGQHVVRLKGGDPFVLGRGGEEVAACADAGVAYEVVPGVTSAVAAPAIAGIPVTHRGVARDVTIVSAHCAQPDDAPDWAALARLSGTLVILMGVGHLEEVVTALRTHGRRAETPVAIVERGTTPQQRTTTATLSDIAAVARDHDVRAPAVIVVGEVVSVGASARASPATNHALGGPAASARASLAGANGYVTDHGAIPDIDLVAGISEAPCV